MTAPARWRGQELSKLNRSCFDKRRYADEYAARAVAQIMCEQGSAKAGAMWVYPCLTCRGWHLTSSGGSAKRMVTVEHIYPARDGKPASFPDTIPQRIKTPQFGGFWRGHR